MKKFLTVAFMAICSLSILTGCGAEKKGDSGKLSVNKEEDVTLTVAGPWSDWPALEHSIASFTKEYPNCNITYEYLQDYSVTLPTRLEGSEDKIDMFLTDNIQKDSELIPYTQELSVYEEELDLSNTFQGLVDNYKIQSADAKESQTFYAIPLGGEVRGMFVNKTLLQSLNLEVPSNKTEFLNACKVLSEHGYIPVQGNPGMFGQQLLYPYICNLIANAKDYEATYNMVNKHEEGTADLLREPMELMYELTEKKYYNYKYCETELGLFTDASDEGYARSFLNILETDSDYEKKDDIGQFAFMPCTKALTTTMDKIKEDYHSKIDYEFILSPVADEGGFAYLSPGKGMAINKSSDHIDWSLVFMNYLLGQEENVALTEEMGYVPNTKNALEILKKDYDVPTTSICDLGQVTFDYNFFSVVNESLMEISKGNNPKYMKLKKDGTSEMYPFSYYMDNLTERFAQVG